jgi:hypothetical protein
MVPRHAPDLAWHAYAAGYGLRVRGLGLRAAVTGIALTHDSRMANPARLDVAHATVADRDPE